jgi:hypothetical protein
MVALSSLMLSPASSSRCIPNGIEKYWDATSNPCSGKGILDCAGTCRIYEYNKGGSCKWLGIPKATCYECTLLKHVTQPIYYRNGSCNVYQAGFGGGCACQTTSGRISTGATVTVDSCKEKCIEK